MLYLTLGTNLRLQRYQSVTKNLKAIKKLKKLFKKNLFKKLLKIKSSTFTALLLVQKSFGM